MTKKCCLKLACGFFIVTALVGMAVVGIGIWTKVDNKNTSSVFSNVNDTVGSIIHAALMGYILIGLGCFLSLFGLLGCLGILKKKSWMFLVFFFAVFFIFILQLAWAVFVLLPRSLKDKPLSSLESKMVKSIESNYDSNTGFTLMWDQTMSKLQCCGFKGFDDFTKSKFVIDRSKYPEQCCNDISKTCDYQKAKSKNVKGCFNMLLNENLVSGAWGFLICFLEIVGMVVSLNVYRFLQRLPDED